MTLFIVSRRDNEVVMATDSLAVETDLITTMITKIHVLTSPMAAITGCGHGTVIGYTAVQCANAGGTFDAMAEHLPELFRKVSDWKAATPDPIMQEPTSIVLAGWSESAEEMTAIAYSQDRAGAPIEVMPVPRITLHPWNEAALGEPPSPDDLATADGLITAACKMRDLTAIDHPTGIGGPLVVTRLTRQRVTIEQIYDLG